MRCLTAKLVCSGICVRCLTAKLVCSGICEAAANFVRCLTGERHFQRHIHCPPSKSMVHTPPSKRGHSRCACMDANLSLCRRNTIIRAVHALMPTCVCVVAIPRDGQELRRLNAVAARCRHTSTRPGCTQTEHGRLLSTAHCCRPVSREQDTEHMQSEQAPDPLQQRRPHCTAW